MVLTQGPDYTRLAWGRINRIEPGTSHHFRLESTRTHLSLAIDGVTAIDYAILTAMDAPDAATFGFDQILTRQQLSHIRVYSQRPPQFVSPLVAGDALFSARQFALAGQRYAEIADAYPDSDLAATAQFGAALCLLRQGQSQQGLERLQDFERLHPAHEMVPFSMDERLQLAFAGKDRTAADAILAQFVRFRGDPMLRRVLGELSEQDCSLLVPSAVTTIGGQPYPADIELQIRQAAQELGRWAGRYGLDADESRFMSLASVLASEYGYNQLAIDCMPISQATADAYLDAGRFQEILDRPALRAYDGQQVMLFECRFDEALKDFGPDAEGPIRQMRADQQRCEHPAPLAAMESAWKVDQERLRTASLAALSHDDQMPFLLPEHLLESRLDAELLTRCPDATHALRVEALRMLSSGRIQDGTDLLGRIPQAPILRRHGHAEDEAFVAYLVPLMLAHDRGLTVDPRLELGPAMPALHQAFAQQIWYMAAYLGGMVDDQAFLQQPMRFLAPLRLHIVQGMAAELRGDKSAALAAYAMIAPPVQEPDCMGTFCAWRRQLLADAH